MNDLTKELNVIYSTDDNYSRPCGVSIKSLLEKNHVFFDNINIYLIDNGINEQNKEIIKEIVNQYKANIIFLNCVELCKDLKKNNNFPMSAYARLFIQEIDGIDKILYIDCDTIIHDNLENLWNINIEKYYIAAVQDCIQDFFMTPIGLKKEDRYINSGVLLINLKKWRNENIKEKFLNFINQHNGNVVHHDQGVINGICKNSILYISPKYNLMPEMIELDSSKIKKLYKMKNFYSDKELQEARDNPIIIHYISKFYNRPWYKKCQHPLKNEFLKYLAKTEFSQELLNGDLKPQIKYRRWIYKKFPFTIYILNERILNIRRKIKTIKGDT